MSISSKELNNKLDHSRAAYQFALRSLPNPNNLEDGEIQLNGFTFKNESHINSMRIELGWAFFCRYEGCFEYHLKQNNIKLSKKLSLLDWFKNNNIVIPDEFVAGLKCYRTIRNKLHHEDGTSFDGTADEEIHLLPEHMENFHNLFIWCGEKIENTG